jgi:hypothetical protein
MRTLLASIALALALAPTACTSDPPAGGFAPPRPAPVATPVEPAAPTAPAAGGDDNPLTKIYAQLEVEKAQRPNPGPSVEAVVAKLAGAELAPVDLKQYVGSTVRARYCAGGRAASGIHVAICEYASPAAAAAARTFVMSQLPELNPSRLVVVRGATTITVTGAPVAETEAKINSVLDGS